MFKPFLPLLLVAGGAAPQAAEPPVSGDLSCRNEAAEISCADGACTIESEAFTPMQLSLSGDDVELCAYTGCMSGTVVSRVTADELTLIDAALVSTPPPGFDSDGAEAETETIRIGVIHNAQSNTAQLAFGSYMNVMDCGGA